LWSGQLVSWVGTEVSGIALPLVVLALTGSPAQAGIIVALRGLVYVVLALPTGTLIDRWDRKIIMVLANAGSGVAMGSIFLALLLKHLTLAQLYIAGVIEGAFFVFANLARFASLPNVVTKEDYPVATAQTSMADNFALLVGPPLGGFLYQTVGPVLAFFTDALSYLVNACSIFFINVPLQAEKSNTNDSLRIQIREGVQWWWKQPTLRFLNVLTAGRTVIASGLYLLIIVLAKQHHASSLVIGFIFTFGALGGIIGSLFASRIHQRFSFRELLAGTTSLNCFIFACYVFASTDVVLAAVTAALYIVSPLYEVTTSTYAASVVPDTIRGRITSLSRLVILGSYSLGFFATGLSLQFFGTMWTIIFYSCLLLLLALMAMFNPYLDVKRNG
jgi:MFS family permease